MLFVGRFVVRCPLVWAVKPCYHALGEHTFQVSQQDNVELPMVVYPATVALLGMPALDITTRSRVEYLVK